MGPRPSSSALGHAMQSQGRKKVHLEFEDGQRGVVDFQVGNVTRVILSAGLLAGTVFEGGPGNAHAGRMGDAPAHALSFQGLVQLLRLRAQSPGPPPVR